MKQISVITLHSVNNYGTQLQAYATQELLQRYLGQVEFVNYRRPDTYGRGLRKLYSRGNMIRWLVFLPTYLKWRYIFSHFQSNRLNISKQKYLTWDDFKTNPIRADVYFSGSDQVWNTGWNNGVIPPFYLSYAPDNKPKYAFSSSFGQSKLPIADVPTVKSYLRRYNHISVRENTGLTILKQQLKINNAIQLNDPTLAFNANFWRNLKNKNKIHQKYILIYNLNNNPKFDEYANKVAEQTGYKLYRFCTRYDQILKNGKSLLIPKVEDFVTYIDDAELVITDSFHATAFAANLNTNLIVIPPEKYASRLTDFIQLIQANSCIAKNYDDFSPLCHKVDFKK